MNPAVTILTPSYRMVRFLPEAVESVLAQDVSGIEYLVLDAASDDGTVEFLRTCGDKLRWRSRPDSGAADALRQGFAEARGGILGWLNADDVLLPGAVAGAVEAFRQHPDAAAVFGNAWWTDEAGERLERYPVSPDAANLLTRECLICQPACFFRAETYRACGGIDASLSSAFDYDLWCRLAHHGRFIHVARDWACSRMHAANKSLGQRRVMFREGMNVLERHFGYVPFQWVYGSLAHTLDRRDQFFEALRPSLAAYALSLPAGLWRNRRHPLRYAREWQAVMSWGGLRRRLGSLR